MNDQTSILTDSELDAVTGGSAGSSFMNAMGGGAATGGKQRPPNFGVGGGLGTGGNTPPCHSNHNDVVYPPL